MTRLARSSKDKDQLMHPSIRQWMHGLHINQPKLHVLVGIDLEWREIIRVSLAAC